VAEDSDIDYRAEYYAYKSSTDHLVRRLDALLNGAGAAPQAALIDLIAQAQTLKGDYACVYDRIRVLHNDL
jgi:hypothetical protein